MSNSRLNSILIECRPSTDTVIPRTTGHLMHGLFLSWIMQCDRTLNARLHNGPSPRPYTLSPLLGGKKQGDHLALRPDIPCFFRLTLLDGGEILDRLKTSFLEAGPILGRFGASEVRLIRLISTPSSHHPLWVASTDWQRLPELPPQRRITFSFRSPTAFSRGERQFDLFPQPLRIWESLLRVWNSYAPESLHIEKKRVRQAFSDQEVIVTYCNLRTRTLHYPDYLQKGFLGTCTYHIRSNGIVASELTALAALAPYAGLGYKTTMGMGQVSVTFQEGHSSSPLQGDEKK